MGVGLSAKRGGLQSGGVGAALGTEPPFPRLPGCLAPPVPLRGQPGGDQKSLLNKRQHHSLCQVSLLGKKKTRKKEEKKRGGDRTEPFPPPL